MEYIRLGRTNLEVSRLGFGGIPIQRLSEEEAVTVVERCLDHGVTFIDTANAYTTSEELIGKAISGHRDKLILATKSAARSCEEIQNHLELSLKRLKVEYIDLYQVHHISDLETLEAIFKPDGLISVLEEAKKQGKIRHIGFSAHLSHVAKEAIKSERFETVMFPLNFIVREPAEEVLPLAREHDMGFIAMKPLAGGMLDNPRLAFKFLLQFPDIVMIPGIEKVNEIDEIVRVMEGSTVLTDAEEQEIQQLREELGTKFCRRCEYCKPCPAGIQIPTALHYPSIIKREPVEKLLAGFFAETMEKAAECTECGECEGRCPYQLPIRAMLAEHVDIYKSLKSKYQQGVMDEELQ